MSIERDKNNLNKREKLQDKEIKGKVEDFI